jgi:hypothetical protein
MMADKTIDAKYLYLIDNWPGQAQTNQNLPETRNGYTPFTDPSHHDVTEEAYPLGTKVQVYCNGADGSKGWATFIYLKLNPTGAAPPTPAAQQVVTGVDADEIYAVTNDKNNCLGIGKGPIAVMLSDMSATADGDAYYGWFWCGGVCPVDIVPDLDGNFATDSTVAIGPIVAAALTADAIGFAAHNDEGSGDGDVTPPKLVAGYATAADAA